MSIIRIHSFQGSLWCWGDSFCNFSTVTFINVIFTLIRITFSGLTFCRVILCLVQIIRVLRAKSSHQGIHCFTSNRINRLYFRSDWGCLTQH